MNWLALGAMYVLWRWGWSKHDPQRCAEKRELARVGLARSGLAAYADNLHPVGNGLAFTVAESRRRDFLKRLESRVNFSLPSVADQARSPESSRLGASRQAEAYPTFLAGSLYWFHSDKVGCNNLGDCRDYRTPNGAIGKGSLQIVYNRANGQGFVDYDKFNPYESWWNFCHHAEEI